MVDRQRRLGIFYCSPKLIHSKGLIGEQRYDVRLERLITSEK